MKAVLLCAGYGTRLQRDLQNDQTGSFKHLLGLPKPLMPIGGRPLISRWLDIIEEVSEIEEVIVVANDFYFEKFQEWQASLDQQWSDRIRLINDGSRSNDERLGAVACIQLAVTVAPEEDLLVIAGDTLFHEDFSLNDFIRYFDGSCTKIVHCHCPEDQVSKRGIIEMDPSTGRVVSFLEKPQPQETTSRKQCPCFYLIGRKDVPLIKEFLDSTAHLPLEKRDATGNFLAYLIEKAEVFSVPISGRFDIGGLEAYVECCVAFPKE